MHDALPVGEIQRVGRLAHDAQHFAEGQRRRGLHAVREIRAADELEGQIEHALGFAGVEQRDHVRVDQLARRLGFAQQPPLAVLHVLRLALRHAYRLDRQLALDLGVLGQVDVAHGARTQQANDPVATEDGAEGQRPGHARSSSRCSSVSSSAASEPASPWISPNRKRR